MAESTLYRALSPRWSFAPLSGEGAAINGGRWNAAGTPALYLACDIITAILEYQQRGGFKPVMVAEYRLTDARIADLDDRDIAARYHVVEDVLTNPWRFLASTGHIPPSWGAADAMSKDGFHGLRYRSQLNRGPCLALWRWNDGSGANLEIHDPQGDLPKDGRSWSS